MGEPDDVSMGPESECESQGFPGQRLRSRQGKRGGGRCIVRKVRDQVKRSVLAGAGCGGVACGRASGMPKIQVYLHLVEAGNLV